MLLLGKLYVLVVYQMILSLSAEIFRLDPQECVLDVLRASVIKV